MTGVQIWAPEVRISGTILHGLAILVTIFRLLYRWRRARFWWEDAWATLALICDIGCLVSVWTQQAPTNPKQLPRIDIISNWLLSLTITAVLWFARLSILSSIVRIANPAPKMRRVAYCIGASFLAMAAGLLAQKLVICVQDLCHFTNPVALSQLVTDIVSDIILVAAPIRFLRDVKLSHDRRILILSTFSASILITGVTIAHSVLLLQAPTTVTVIIGHVKAALALLVCNALVIVTFIYRLIRKSDVDLERSIADELSSSAVQFTSVVELSSRFSSRGPSTGRTTYVKSKVSDISSAKSSIHQSRASKAVAFSKPESPRGEYHVCQLGDGEEL